MDRSVWYAAYGSNLLRARFMAYLQGGSVRTDGSGPVETGADNPSPPMDDRPARLDGWQLVFAGRSRRWSMGGVCSVVPVGSNRGLQPGPAPPEVLGRAWLITAGQLTDVWRQENAGVALETERVVAAVDRGVDLEAESGAYRRLACLGKLDGVPMFTITGTDEVLSRLNRPDPAYRSVVADGLSEAWGMTVGEIDCYLAACPGVGSA